MTTNFPRLGLKLAAVLTLAGGFCASAQSLCTPPPELRGSEPTVNGAGTLGNWFSAHGQPSCAVQTFRHALSRAPGSAPLHYSLGMALLSMNDEAAAAKALEDAVQLDPAFDRACLVLGVLAHNRGDTNAALRYWQRAAELNTGSTVALDWIAKTRIEQGQYTAAVDLLRSAPTSEDLAIDLMLAQTRARFADRAIASAQDTLRAHPVWQKLRLALGTTMVQENRFEEGVQLLEAATEAQPESLEVQTLYLRVLILMNNTAKAQPLGEKLLHEHPHDFDVLYLNGLMKREDGSYAEALPLLQEAERERPEHFDVHFNLGTALLKLRRPAEARTELRQAVTMPDASPEAHFQLAVAERQMGDAAAAGRETRIYQQTLAARSAHDELVSLSAQAAQKLQAGDPAAAAELERRILTKFPEDAVHWYDLSLALHGSRDSAGERDALEHAIRLRPDFALALNALGLLQAGVGQAVAAEASFRAATAAAPQFAEAENNLGSVLSQTGRDAEAETCFRAALAANPRAVDAWINLAATLAARGQTAEARHALDSALELQPGNHDAEQLRAMLAQAATVSQASPSH